MQQVLKTNLSSSRSYKKKVSKKKDCNLPLMKSKSHRLNAFLVTINGKQKCTLHLSKSHRKIMWRSEIMLNEKIIEVDEVSFSTGEIIGISKPIVRKEHVDFWIYTFSRPNGSCVCGTSLFRRRTKCIRGRYLFRVPLTSKQTKDDVDTFMELFNQTLYSGEGEKRPRKIAVVLNPFSGYNLAKEIYESQVKEMFEQANISVEYHETKSSAHVNEIATNIDVKDLDGLIAVGGDGLVHQIINAILKREDSSLALTVPIGVIPAGSQNALQISINGGRTIEECVFNIIRGETRGLDVIDAYNTATQNHIYSVTTVSYGLLGDILQDSENYRWMGPSRYQYSALRTFVGLRHYEANVSYVPADCTEDWENNENCWIKLDYDQFTILNAFNISGANSQTAKQCQAKSDDGLITLVVLKRTTRFQAFNFLLHAVKGTHSVLDTVDIIQAQSVKITPPDDEETPINIDGELHDVSPLHLKCLSRHASIFVNPAEGVVIY